MTWVEWTGSAGFLCYFLYDINSVTWKNRLLQRFFLLGTLLVAFSSAGIVADGWNVMKNQPVRTIVFGLLALLWLALLVYTLFFALPFQETYLEKNQKRKTYTEGMYALCRHPGVLWFALFYLSLALLLGTSCAVKTGCLLTAWDVCYICLQDMVIFPRTFCDYKEYKKTTPFLFPNRKSVGKCLRFFGKERKK